MRLRAKHHGSSTAARALTLLAVVVASVGQFTSLAHEMTVWHFRCADHGELTHVAVAGPASADGAGRTVAANHTLHGATTSCVDAHEHCGLAFTTEGSAPAPSACAPGCLAPPPPGPAPPAPRLHGARTVALAAAPKTSPPRA
ncbi:MAG TPA: hypothetical protein VHO67_19625 [Polyangia bacterium]|nr:hypothetical protein [Polyangia bacterium]